MATKKLVTVQQLDRAVDGFASAVAAAGYEKKANLKALAYVDEIADTHLASSITTVLAGKLTAARARELVDQNVGKAYKPGGNATLATLPTADAAHFGYVYNMTEDFTTTDDFVEGANTTHKAGAEVAVVEVEGSDPVVYKYNVLSGYIDTTKFAAQSSFTVVKTAVDNVIFASATDIQNLIDGLSLEEEITKLVLEEGDEPKITINFIGDTSENRPNSAKVNYSLRYYSDGTSAPNYETLTSPNWNDHRFMSAGEKSDFTVTSVEYFDNGSSVARADYASTWTYDESTKTVTIKASYTG